MPKSSAGDQASNASLGKDWQETPTFSVAVTTSDGKKVDYVMRGEEGRFGFIDSPFIAGQSNKYMWHFWGNANELVGKTLKVTGVSQSASTKVDVLTTDLSGPNNTATAHVPSTMSLPTPGLWRLDVTVDGRPIGSVVVRVQEK